MHFTTIPIQQNEVTGIGKEFVRKIGTKSKAVLLEHSIAQPIFFYVAIQNRLAMVESYNDDTGIFEAHSWLKRNSFIGGD